MHTIEQTKAINKTAQDAADTLDKIKAIEKETGKSFPELIKERHIKKSKKRAIKAIASFAILAVITYVVTNR